MIIIEGPDLVGKTTLCKELVKAGADHGLIYSHFTRLPDAFDRYWGYFDRASRWVVQDRFHMSEVVYAKMRGDKTDLCKETYRLVDGQLRRLGAVHVVVTAEDSMIADRYDREEMYPLEKVLAVNKLFKKAVVLDIDDYVMDLDIHIGCTPAKPFPDAVDVRRIMDLWRERQLILQTTIDSDSGAL